MCPLFGIAITSGHRLSSSQYGRLNYKTFIPAKGRGNPTDMWHVISAAPFDRDLELALVDANGVHAIFFPCRRVLGGWIKAKMKTPIKVHPTHWRDWAKDF
jgi:hypothetical protein